MSKNEQARHLATNLKTARKRDIKNQKEKGGGKNLFGKQKKSKINKHEVFKMSSSESEDEDTEMLPREERQL